MLEEIARKKRRGGDFDSILSVADDGMYRPKTRDTRLAYEKLLAAIQAQFGDQPNDILRGAADEVLAVLKSDKFRDPEKKKEIENLLNPKGMPSEKFAELMSIGKEITDYQEAAEETGPGEEGLDDDIGVAVEFEDEDEEEESDLDEVRTSEVIHRYLLVVFF
jgi:pre-mRNA-splicing helicase BRR2